MEKEEGGGCVQDDLEETVFYTLTTLVGFVSSFLVGLFLVFPLGFVYLKKKSGLSSTTDGLLQSKFISEIRQSLRVCGQCDDVTHGRGGTGAPAT